MTRLLSISSLGPFQASLASSSLDKLNSGKLSALLIYLVMKAGHKLRREYLAELLWPDMPIVSARSNLRHAFFRLRQMLGDDTNAHSFLLSGREWLSFNPDSSYRLDAHELGASMPSCPSGHFSTTCQPCLTKMEYMASLYRGEFMADLSLPDCAEFNDWLESEREAMRRRVLTLLERLSVCHVQISGHSKALPFAQRYHELEPWNEEGLRMVMQLYALNGQASTALVQYDTCSKLLRKELGVLPSSATQQLAENIRNGQVNKQTRDGRTVNTRVGDRRSVDGNKALPMISPMPLAPERRQATALYCEIAHTGNEDIDEAMAILMPTQARCAEIIRQYSGHLLQTHGGGLLAYFGYPQAREDAACLAVRAALATTRETGRGIEIRAGVHTGHIITGGDTSFPDAVGKTSRLAIQLRQVARPGEVAISQKTQQLVDGYFDCTILPGRSFSGIDRESNIYRVIRESGARNRLDASVKLTPLAGRKSEIDELLKLWESAKQGEPHVVLVQGEAGIGKSRLLHTLKDHLSTEPHSMRELRCSPELSMSPFYPVITLLEEIFDFSADDTADIKLAKLSRYLQTHHPDQTGQSLSFLAQLLSIPVAQKKLSVSPQEQKIQTQAIVLSLLKSLSSQQPLLLIIEDLHWIDPSTLEMLGHFVTQKYSGPILTLLSARHEFSAPWKESLHLKMNLMPLDEDEVTKMIQSVEANISTDILQQIVKRADGIPLFVEEMTKIASAGRQASIPISIPATLHDLLLTRLDSVGEARRTAHLAASIGREFDLDLLRKISPLAPTAFEYTLRELLDSGLVLAIGDALFQFKHALIQEAAYQSQTVADRQAAHGLIAQTLQDDFKDVIANQPELLAQHLAASGDTQHAIECWIKAGQRAAINSANLEVIEHFNAARQLLMTLPENQERDRMEFAILVNLCPILYATKGYGSAEATQANARLSALSGPVGDSPELFLAKWALVMNTIAGIGSRDVPKAAMRLLEMSHGDPLRKQAAHYAIADAAFWLGEFEIARSHTDLALALYHPNQSLMLLEQFGEDLSVSCTAYLSWSLYFLGYSDRAQLVCAQMLEQARKVGHPHTLALALCFASVLHRWLNKPSETLSLSTEAIAVSRQHNFSVWLAAGEMTHGWALSMQGQTEGIDELKAGIAGMRAAIGGISIVFLSALIEAYVHLEMYNEALVLIAEAQDDEVRTGDGHFTAELHRFKGLCLLALSPSNAAQPEACFKLALAISRKQGAKPLELRAAMSMSLLPQ